MSERPFVSVIILSYNSSKLGNTFLDCVRSVLNSDYPRFEVLIVDNASSDGSAENAFLLFREMHPNLKFVRLETNLGYAGGNNAGVENITKEAELVAFLNDDIIVRPDWLELLVKAILTSNRAGVVGPSGHFLTKGASAVGLTDPTLCTRIHEVGWIQGYCMLVKREQFGQVSGFNQNFFMYNEDIDLCERLRSLGFGSFEVPLPNLVHGSPAMEGVARASSKKYFLNARNTFFLVYQGFEPSLIPIAVTIVLLNKFKRSLSLLNSESLDAFRETVKGTFSGLAKMNGAIRQSQPRKPFHDPFFLPITLDLLHLVLRGKKARPIADSIILRKNVQKQTTPTA